MGIIRHTYIILMRTFVGSGHLKNQEGDEMLIVQWMLRKYVLWGCELN